MTSNDCSEVDYTSFEEVFPAFWEANLKGDYSCIDFNKAFTELRRIWFDFEVGHRGGLGFEKWFEYLEADHMNTDPKLGGSVLFAEKVGLTDEEAWDLLQTDRKKLMELYHPIFEEEYNDQKDDPLMKELVKTRLMMMRPPEDLSSNILLMDRVVNAVHLGGWTIYPGFDIDSWRKEAERGFTSKQSTQDEPCPEINYSNHEGMIFAFWIANINKDYSCFDFDEALKTVKNSIENYIELNMMEHDLSDWAFYSELFNLRDAIDKLPNNAPISEKVFLFDSAIHYQHMSGSIFWSSGVDDWIDVDVLREIFDEKH